MADFIKFTAILLGAIGLFHLLKEYIRLSHVPGPILARFNSVWRLWAMNKPAYGERLVQLHRKYGPVIRLGPNHVCTSDHTMIPVIFGTNPVWIKAPSYAPSTPFSGGKSMPSVVAMTEAQSTVVHRVSGAAFTAHALLDYEDYIDQSCGALLSALKKRPSPIDLSWWFNLFAMDVINRIAFSDSMGFLETGEDVENLMAATKDRFDHWGKWHAIPGIERFLFKSQISRLWNRQKVSPLAAAAQNKLRIRMDPSNSEKFKGRPDLLGKFLDGAAKHPGLVTEKEIIGMTQSTIGAGADTTAATLAILYIYLGRHPETVTKLRNEIHAAKLSSPPKWDEVRSLPFLEAVIKEAIRLLPVSQWDHARVAPPEGATVSGQFVPGGTTVQISIDSVHRSEVFGSDPDSFNPERWLRLSDERLLRMNGAMLGFGAGKRMCLGKHIAWLEMKKLIPLLVTELDIQLLGPDIDVLKDIEPSSVRYIPPLLSNVKVREGTSGRTWESNVEV